MPKLAQSLFTKTIRSRPTRTLLVNSITGQVLRHCPFQSKRFIPYIPTFFLGIGFKLFQYPEQDALVQTIYEQLKSTTSGLP